MHLDDLFAPSENRYEPSCHDNLNRRNQAIGQADRLKFPSINLFTYCRKQGRVQTMATPNFDAPIANPFGYPGNSEGYLDVAFGDIDNDGDLDLFTNDFTGNTQYFQNTGSASALAFAAGVTNPFGLSDAGLITTIALADINNDGDLDIFIGQYASNGTLLYFQNTGTASAPTFAPGVVLVRTGDIFAPSTAFADIDNDGDLDLFSGSYEGNTLYFQNTGTASAPVFAPVVVNPFGLTDAGDITKPTFGDLDNDGDLDLLIGETNSSRLNYFQNIGTASAPAFAPLVTNPFGLRSGLYPEPNLVDINNDGDLDVFDAQLVDDLRFFENNANDPRLSVTAGNNATEPSTPGNFTLTLSKAAPAGGLTVFYTLSGTATNGTDYTTLPGSFTFAAGATTATVTVAPIADNLVEGDETVIFTLLDRSGYTLGATTTATITLTDPPNQPPVAAKDTATTNEDTPVNINVLANDSDADGNPLTLSIATNPTNGTAVVNNNNTPGNPNDDLITYTPNVNFNGTDTFTYTISDGQGGTDTAQVNLTINPVNDAPVAGDDTATTNEDTPVNINRPLAQLKFPSILFPFLYSLSRFFSRSCEFRKRSNNVLANDSDIDGNPLTLSITNAPTKGTAVINNNNTPGNSNDDFITYTPNANFNGTDTFTYKISDGNGDRYRTSERRGGQEH